MSLFTVISDQWVSFVFGTPAITGLMLLLFFTIFGIRHGWNAETFALVLIPFIAVTSAFLLPSWVFAVTLIAMSLIISIAVIKIMGR